MRPLLLALLLCLQQGLAHAADIYGYIDSKGVAHFASEKIDERYQIFFRGGQSFDTAQGISPLGRNGRKIDGKVPPASQTLLALFEASPSYKTAKSALRDASNKHSIDYELLQALIATESGFDAQAVSPKGAMGLMQLMPATAQRYGVAADKRTTIEKKLFDPRINIATGSRYLRDLIAMFPGQIELALAAYNAGEGAVQRAGNKIPNYKETQNYVQTVLQLYAYLKPSVATGGGGGGARGGKTPGRIRMELVVPKGGALGRGNMPPDSPAGMPAMPDIPEQPQVPAGAVEPPVS
jgi:Transglycosylase SLT domain